MVEFIIRAEKIAVPGNIKGKTDGLASGTAK